tara:strand:+ start:86 stop:457 length:372 start_codon:yes stop_codon:yes gene_type:complete
LEGLHRESLAYRKLDQLVTSSPLNWGLFLCLQGAFGFVLGVCTGTLVFTAYRGTQGLAWVPLFLPVNAQSLTAGFAHVVIRFPVDGGTLVFMAGGLWGVYGGTPFFTHRRKPELAKDWGYPIL